VAPERQNAAEARTPGRVSHFQPGHNSLYTKGLAGI
jgi:hypothetical protein